MPHLITRRRMPEGGCCWVGGVCMHNNTWFCAGGEWRHPAKHFGIFAINCLVIRYQETITFSCPMRYGTFVKGSCLLCQECLQIRRTPLNVEHKNVLNCTFIQLNPIGGHYTDNRSVAGQARTEPPQASTNKVLGHVTLIINLVCASNAGFTSWPIGA